MKARLILISIAFFLALPFLMGLFFIFDKEGGQLYWLVIIHLIYAVVISLALGIYVIAYFIKKKGAKGLLLALFILIVSIPLILTGTCFVEMGGGFIRGLFVK